MRAHTGNCRTLDSRRDGDGGQGKHGKSATGRESSRRLPRHASKVVRMSVVVHAGRLRQEMARRGWAATDLAREATLSPATVSAALGGRAISATSVGLIAAALSRVPASAVIDSLIMADNPRELGL